MAPRHCCLPVCLKNALAAGRQRCHTAARPVSQVSMASSNCATLWGAGQFQHRQAGQHRARDARPVPALADRPRHPQPQGDHNQGGSYRHRDDERAPPAELGSGEVVSEHGQVIGTDVADEGQRGDQLHGGADGAPYMSLTAASTGAGAADRSSNGWPGDGTGWDAVASAAGAAAAARRW
jgi:hypothetical protein